MSVRSQLELNAALSSELQWRKRELTTLRFAIQDRSLRDHQRALALRSGLALLYAHWEGFVKKASRYYLEYVRSQRLSYHELAANLIALDLRKSVKSVSPADQLATYIETVQRVRLPSPEKPSIPDDVVSTRSSLKSDVLREIVIGLGLDFSFFEPKSNLIDERLVGARNTIAHGEFADVEVNDLLSLQDEVMLMIEAFRNQIENAAATGSFRWRGDTVTKQ